MAMCPKLCRELLHGRMLTWYHVMHFRSFSVVRNLLNIGTVFHARCAVSNLHTNLRLKTSLTSLRRTSMADAGNVEDNIEGKGEDLLLQKMMGSANTEKFSRKLVTCFDVRGRSALQFKLTGLPSTDFCSFVETAGKPHVVRFFGEIMEELEVKRGIMDFHLKIRDKKSSFVVDVYHGDQVAGPVVVLPGACISCNLNTPLYPGDLPMIIAGECVLPQFNDQPYVQCHLDAKARPGFIVTPKRHVERLSEMDNEEVYALWTVAVRALREDSIPYRSMILNHGTYRNLPHLHLKIWVTEEDHMKVRQHWTADRQELWARLQILAATLQKRKVACRYFQRNGSCRYGAQCKFEHL